MEQLFHPAWNVWSRVLLGVLITVPVILFFLPAISMSSAWSTGVGMRPAQPVPFSHKHHVTDDGIDCRYCHTTVERSRSAGMPPSQICMHCHSVIWGQAPVLAPVRISFTTGKPLQWTRVYDLPDFVYFDHSVHVQRGVSCVSCHGRVDQMPLTELQSPMQMRWCLDCHRHPETSLRPKDKVFNFSWTAGEDQLRLGNQLMRDFGINTKQITNCSVCHR